MAKSRRVQVKGIKREELDTELLGVSYWLLAKSALRERRAREAKSKAKQRRKAQ